MSLEVKKSNFETTRISKYNDETKTDSEVVDYDQLLYSAGEFGPYQFYLSIMTLPFYMFGCFSYFSQIFLTEVSPDHWCWVPELANLTDIERRNLAIPTDKSQYGYSRCKSYVANWTEVLVTGAKPDHTWAVAPCQHGWEYSSDIPYKTITSEMNWVCDQASYQASAQSFFFVGSIIGGFIVGWVADRFGRLPAAVFSNMIACIAGTATIFSNNFVQFTVCRFFMGMSYDNCMMMAYLIVLEYVVPKYRTLISNLTFAIFFSISCTSLPWIALACGHWKTIALATSLPMALSLLAPFVMPESPRWLLSKGRIDDAVNKVLKIARVNKKNVPPELIEKFKLSASVIKTEEGNIKELLTRPLMRRIFICICLEFTFSMIIFDALIRTIGQLKFDFFISFAVTSFTELPSLLLLSLILDRTGRKCMMMVGMSVCGVFSFLIPFIGSGIPAVICAVIARFAINMSCNTAVQWVAELLPTSVRGSGTSIAHICGYIGIVISPFIAYLERVQFWLPMVLVGTMSTLGAVLALSLPETAGEEMPETFEATEELYRNQKILDPPCLRKNIDDQALGQVNQTFEMN